MVEPNPLTNKYCLAQIAFHESGAEWYRSHRSKVMADWSQEMVDQWQRKLEALAIQQEGGKTLA